MFRNDKSFNCVKIDENFSITHRSEPTPTVEITHSDYYGHPGTLTIPVGAIDSCTVEDVKVPTLHFTFPDYPDAGWVKDKEAYIDATLDIEGAGIVEDAKELLLKVKGRGNTSWTLEKKPMRLKFAKKTSICGFKKAKSYVLLADYLDPSKMRNVVGLWLARRLGMQYSNHTQPCNVYVNGKYAGLYLLTEKVGINSGSVDIDETTGILFEMGVEFDEKYKFRSPINNIPMMVKDPDFDELFENDSTGLTPDERLAMWQADFNLAEKETEYSKSGFDYFDLESTVNYLLTSNIVCNSEIGFPKSVFLYKESIDEKYKFGPIWDLDVSCNFLKGTDNSGVNDYTSMYDFACAPDQYLWVSGVLYKLSQYVEFKSAYRAKFEEFYQIIFPELLDFIDEYAQIIESAAKMDGVKWPREYITSWCSRANSFDRKKHVGDLKTWLIQRMEVLRARAAEGNL